MIFSYFNYLPYINSSFTLNCKTAVVHNGGWKDQQINETYQELAEHYGTAIIPARVRAPKDKPNAEGTVGNISTWITAALRDEQFFLNIHLLSL